MSCQLEQPPEKNLSSFKLDGAAVKINQDSAAAYIDRSKKLAGPNTHLFFAVAAVSDVEGEFQRILQVNLPVGVGPGAHHVRYKQFPGRNDVWVGYYDARAGKKWIAYDGVLNVVAADEEGGRFKASFSDLKLTNPCGEQRRLTNGTIDARVGSEDSWVHSAVWTPEDDDSDADMVENNIVLELDGTIYACPYADLSPFTESAGDNSPITMIRVIAPCRCFSDGNADAPDSFFAVRAELPTKSSDVEAGVDSFAIYVDKTSTPDDLADDELWFGLYTPKFTLRASGTTLRAPIDIDVEGPDPLAFVVRGTNPIIDVSRVRMLARASIYGFIDSE